MKIQVNTDDNIQGSDVLNAQVEEVIESNLRHFRDQVTRVEVHLSDENSQKGGARDKRCLMEVRLEGRQPVAVTHQAGTVNEAINGAARKLKASLDSIIGKLSSQMKSPAAPKGEESE
ncbi:HPF/RaiA family ribosome-associated protein [Nitrosomonas sp. Nm34]|uniref:HPF/RaiA family ribosome-associated protein n=1 Tax=Nitrosomonas sp. Nm34 TaxID=1881055 RepID=UPI0008E1C44A|nr:HPF/RaiA family ribosome-associated protein [Nitrosomonas sp. Nm34]SFJ05624.1 Sigma 54 modulation protein / S30EA ribosomal protein [Nitrosomonas sp. Nm34]